MSYDFHLQYVKYVNPYVYASSGEMFDTFCCTIYSNFDQQFCNVFFDGTCCTVSHLLVLWTLCIHILLQNGPWGHWLWSCQNCRGRGIFSRNTEIGCKNMWHLPEQWVILWQNTLYIKYNFWLKHRIIFFTKKQTNYLLD